MNKGIEIRIFKLEQLTSKEQKLCFEKKIVNHTYLPSSKKITIAKKLTWDPIRKEVFFVIDQGCRTYESKYIRRDADTNSCLF